MDKLQSEINDILARYEAALPVEERVRAFVDECHKKQGYPGFWEIASVQRYNLGDETFFVVLCYRFAAQIGFEIVKRQCYMHADVVVERDGVFVMVAPESKEGEEEPS